MKVIKIDNYGPIISDKETGAEIYQKIKNSLGDSSIGVDLSNIKSMATFCAKQIFGRLYVELGAEAFFSKIELKNASDDIKTIIKIGIRSALDELNKSE